MIHPKRIAHLWLTYVADFSNLFIFEISDFKASYATAPLHVVFMYVMMYDQCFILNWAKLFPKIVHVFVK